MELYHLSQNNLNNTILYPRIPSNYFTKNGFEDGKTARVCLAQSIDCALAALSQKCTGLVLYVHVPVEDIKVKIPTIREVPDIKITKEVWSLEPVKIKCIGKIKVTGDTDKPYPFKYGNNTAELYFWKWHWIKHFNENVNLTESIIFNKEQLVINFNNWKKIPYHNILFITGLSGSGKSTVAEKLSKEYNAEFIELDNIMAKRKNNTSNLIPKLEKKLPWYKNKNENSGYENKEVGELLHEIIEIVGNDSKRLYIVEGIQIYSVFNMSRSGLKIESMPLIIMGTSILSSFKRRMGRDNWNMTRILKYFYDELRWYSKSDDVLDRIRNKVEPLAEQSVTDYFINWRC